MRLKKNMRLSPILLLILFSMPCLMMIDLGFSMIDIAESGEQRQGKTVILFWPWYEGKETITQPPSRTLGIAYAAGGVIFLIFIGCLMMKVISDIIRDSHRARVVN